MWKQLKGRTDRDGIVSAILDHYYKLPKNGKPNLPNEYTVLSSCYVVVDNYGAYFIQVLSMATGTKCLGLSDCIMDTKSLRVKDCHAEVLSKRCLQRFLAKSMYSYLEELRMDLEREAAATKTAITAIRPSDSQSTRVRNSDILAKSILFPFDVLPKSDCSNHTAAGDGDAGPTIGHRFRDQTIEELVSLLQFRIKPQWHLGLFVSDPLCGDASIYSKRAVISPLVETPVLPEPVSFTGAKLVGLDAAKREDAQTVGATRTKSGRSDLPPGKRTSCMSCSDKVCRWTTVGVQGAALALLLTAPVTFSSILVAADEQAVPGCQQAALDRCLLDRLLQLTDCSGIVVRLPELHIFTATAAHGSSSDASSSPMVFGEGKCRMEAKWLLRDAEGTGHESRSNPPGAVLKASPLSLNWVANASTFANCCSNGSGNSSGGSDIMHVTTTVAAADAVEQWHQRQQKRGAGCACIRDHPLDSADHYPSARGGTMEVLLGQAGLPQGVAAKTKTKPKTKVDIQDNVKSEATSHHKDNGVSGNDDVGHSGKRKADQISPQADVVAHERVVCSRLAPYSVGQLWTQILDVLYRIHSLQASGTQAQTQSVSLFPSLSSSLPLKAEPEAATVSAVTSSASAECSSSQYYCHCKSCSHDYHRRLNMFLYNDKSPFRLWCRGCKPCSNAATAEIEPQSSSQ